jgi:hypothetical protein
LAVDLVDGGVIGNISERKMDLGEIVGREPGRLGNREDIAEGDDELLLNSPAAKLTALGVDRRLTADEADIAGDDRSREGRD